MRKKGTPVVLESREKQKNDTWLSTGLLILFCWLLLAGGIGLFMHLPSLAEGRWILMVSGAAACGLVIISRKSEMTGILVPVLLLFAALALVFLRTTSVVKGILSVTNEVLEKWNQVFHTYYDLFAVSEVTKGEIWVTAAVFGMLFGMFVGYAVYYQWTILLNVLILISLCLSFQLQLNSGFLPEMLLLVGWIAIWTGNLTDNHSRMGTSLFWGLIIIVFGGIVAISLEGYKGSGTIASAKQNMHEVIHQFRYGEDSLPKGNLKKAGQLLKKGEKEKTLQISFHQMEEMYLRGYVGSSYDGVSWNQLSNEAYTGKQTGMLEWLKRNRFSPVFEYAACRNMEKKSGQEEDLLLADTQSETFSIVNNGADRQYIYVPNTVENVTDAKYTEKQDWQLQADGIKGVRSYQFQALTGTRPTEILTEPQWLTQNENKEVLDYQESEGVYRSFVKQYYLDITEEQKAEINRLFFSGAEWKKEWNEETGTKGIYSATSRIRIILGILADYTECPDELPEGRDFVTWFLEDAKKGNAVHFATAAVLAYRTLGIPARYAEGYYISQEQAKQLNDEQTGQVQLTEENGHAWAEIYIDGIGWCPVEVTPGFYHELYSPEKIIDVPQEEVESIRKKEQVDVNETFIMDNDKDPEKDTPIIPWNVTGLILLIVFVILGLTLLLELQRMLRILWAENIMKKRESSEEIRYRYEKICRIFLCAGIREDLRHPYKITPVVIQSFSSVKKEEYERVIQIIQQGVFGQKELRPNERRVLDQFHRKLCTELYRDGSPWKKLYYRYVKCI